MAKVEENAIEDIVSALKKMEYGSLVITVHDGEITQIDTTEKSVTTCKGNKGKSR